MTAIRPARPEDAGTLAALAHELNRHFGIEEPSFGADMLQPLMCGEDPLVFGWLAEEDPAGRAVGYALCQKFLDTDTDTMGTWMLDLYVDAELRSGDTGRALIAQVARYAKDRRQRCIGWSVYSENPARRLYDRVGASGAISALAMEAQI